MKGISILGSTGSIGVNTLNVIERFPDRFRVVGLAAGKRVDRLAAQIEAHRPSIVSVASEDGAREIAREFPELSVFHGTDGLARVATEDTCDFVVSATVGAVGLLPTLRAIECGKAVGLANKETLVVAGEIIKRALTGSGAQLLPIDSEHNAIHQCLDGRNDRPKTLWLTASGGPFRTSSLEEMAAATPETALKHPTWEMGPKISIDSATMMNKGLEVIEACWLFDVGPDDVSIVVHPQSTIHSMVEYEDGSLIAQLGVTDMRLPIQYALTYPERLETGLSALNLATPMNLTFEPPDLERFRCLKLCYEAIRTGGTAPAVLNAANEIAVDRFLAKEIGFLQIPEVIEDTLSAHDVRPAADLEAVLDADRWARERTAQSCAAADTVGLA